MLTIGATTPMNNNLPSPTRDRAPRQSAAKLFLATLTLAGLTSVGLVLAAPPAPSPRFPDFGFMAPPGQYTGEVFRLSQDYPATKPDGKKLPAFFTKLPKGFTPDFPGWRDYMMAVRDYCFEGNLEVDWRVEKNKARKWYHMPWQHYGTTGREGIRGLTKEAPVQPGQLAASQGQPKPGEHYQTYAVGFFNDFGGYSVGQVWKNHFAPNATATTMPNGFLEGTVISKLLFVDVPSEQVPSLINPLQWDAYIQATYENPARSIRAMSLIQMDIAVRDNRAPTGWVFGTFQYNGQLANKVPWQNLIPVGIMWGNDPTITDSTYTNPQPTVTKINPNLKETSINPDPKELPPTHLGWNGRLNGPVDNPQSSCMSCHMTAEYPAISAMSPLFIKGGPAVGTPGWMRWFQNEKCGVPFDKEAKSTDFSLQLAISLQNFDAGYTNLGGIYAEPAQPHATPASKAMMMAPSDAARAAKEPPPPVHGQIIQPIVRDVLTPEPNK
jgi:hypothetical protein